jgi:hypothetical protein
MSSSPDPGGSLLDSMVVQMASFSSYLQVYIVFSLINHVWGEYLNYRQLKKDKDLKIPAKVIARGILTAKDEEKYAETQAYSQDKRHFGMVKSWFDMALGLWALVHLNPWFWGLAGDWLHGDESWRALPDDQRPNEVHHYLAYHFLSSYARKEGIIC